MSRYKIVPQNEITMVNGPWRIYHICFGVFSVKKRTCLQPGCEVSEFQQAPGCVAKNWQIFHLSPYHLGQASDGDNLKDSAAQLMATRISELEAMELAFVLIVNCGKVRNIRHLFRESTKNMCDWKDITVTGNSFTEVDFYLGSVSWCEVYSLVWYIAEWRRWSREEWCSWPFLEVNRSPSLFSGLFVESCFVHEQTGHLFGEQRM